MVPTHVPVTDDTMREFWKAHWSATKFAEEYETNFYQRRQEEFQAIIKYLPRNQLLLEAGCSFGHVAEYFRRLGYSIVGLDYVFDALAAGRLNDSIDGYLSFGVLEHFDFGPMPALEEAFRVLKPNGVIAITMPVPTPLVRDWIPRMRPWLSLDPMRRNRHLRRAFGKQVLTKEPHEHKDNFYEKPYSGNEVREFLDAAGFVVVLQMPIYHSFWLWLASRVFRERGSYYKPTKFAELLARALKTVLPWSTAFMGLAIGIKPGQ
jgi:SAM-dependent methyltransferase